MAGHSSSAGMAINYNDYTLFLEVDVLYNIVVNLPKQCLGLNVPVHSSVLFSLGCRGLFALKIKLRQSVLCR